MAIEIVTTETHGVAFIHLSDYSGNVDIVSERGSTITVPIAALLEFVQQIPPPDWSDGRLDATVAALHSLNQTPLIPLERPCSLTSCSSPP